MIRIHRSKPFVHVDQRRVRLSRAEHLLLTTLGMMDNKIMPMDLLLKTALTHPVTIDADRSLILQRISRLRRKIGPDHLQRLPHGYILVGDVTFIGAAE